MPLPALAILTRIREVLEDGAGDVRALPDGAFGSNTHDALDALADSLASIGKPQAFAKIVSTSRHGSSPSRVGSFTLEALDIEVRIVRGFDGHRDLNADARTALEALAASDAFDVAQALTWPGNMAATEAGAETGLVSGTLRHVGNAIPSTEYTGGQNGRLVTTHRFSGVCRVETPTA